VRTRRSRAPADVGVASPEGRVAGRPGPGSARRARPPQRVAGSSAAVASSSPRAELEARLAQLPDLDRRPSRYGNGLAYYVGDREVVHFHGDQRMDVRLTREVIRIRKAEGGFDARVTTRGPSADWASVRVEAPDDVSPALALVEDAIRANS
jgi:Family of unknown function (DUF5519)